MLSEGKSKKLKWKSAGEAFVFLCPCAFVSDIHWATISVLCGGQRGMQEADALLVLVS
ncbi:MAG: hypothetical protein QOJ02_98 [Acidobacteriota bacterium]|jgi:hypothetical protein|nr:hypothetical protein [Acidobacteriota bacterium]